MTNSGEATVINDRYEVHKRIGRGGMADVFSARDLLLDRQVAIKVLFPEFATDPNFVERFRREAQSAANLNHPNIVSVYDWGKYEGTYFIAMEQVQGRTLAEILSSNRQLSAKQAAEIASEVAAALGSAHDHGVAHRDIKPANILIGQNGQVKVADFGIARAMNAASTESNLTQVGSVMGTATYFSPEQAQGAQPDPRSDLYSLGVVMYEMVAGRPPFTGENPVSIAYKQVHDAPQPLVQIVADIPRPFEAIVAKLLAKDPKLRYPSAGALRDDLRRFRNGEPVQALAAAATAQNVAPTGAIPAAVASATAATMAVNQANAAPTRAQAASVPSAGMVEAGYPTGASADARYYDTSSPRTGWYAIAAFAALIALAIGGVLLFQSLSDEGEASEPTQFTLEDYFNQPLDQVRADLDSKGLTYVTVPQENSIVPPTFVFATNPEAGSVVLKDEIIEVFFNPDPQLRPIPNVVGLPFEEARTRLVGEGFSVAEPTIEETDEFGEGTVLSIDPPAGTNVLQGSTINIVIAGAPDTIQVPGQVVGMTEIDARGVLTSPPFNFNVTTALRASSTVAAGTVIEIQPGAGQLVLIGGDVTIFVSSGPEPVRVPTVTGQTEGRARNTVTDAGLFARVEYRDVPAGSLDDGRVVEQSLAPGSLVDPGTTITLVVARSLEVATTLPPTTTTSTTTTSPPTTVVVTTTAAP